MNRILLLSILLLSSYSYLAAQTLPLFSQYRENQSVVNPAALNMDFLIYEYNFSAGISYRNQWTGAVSKFGADYGPNTKTARTEIIIPRSKVYTGLYLLEDEAGPISTLGGYLRGGYIISSDPAYSGVSLGFSLGLLQYRVDFSHPSLIEAAVSLNREPLKKVFPDAALGFYAYKRIEQGNLEGDWFYVGLSSPQLFELDLTSNQTGRDLDAIKTSLVTKIYGLLGLFKYVNSDSFIESSLWLKYIQPFPGVNMDINLRYQISNIFWMGAGVGVPIRFDRNRIVDFNQIISNLTYNEANLLFEAGFYLGENIGLYDNNVKVGFGYGFILGSYDNPFKNTFEINVIYTRDTDKGRH